MAVLKNKIELKNVSKTYETKDKTVEVLKNLSFEVHENEFLVLLGPGRCGKTVLLNILANLEKQTSGTIEFAGGRPKMGDLGMVFQKYALFPWKTVMGNVEMSQKLKGVDKKVRQEKAQEYINLVGLNGFEKSLPKQLSGGMKQRVGIARAYASESDILLLDEPFGALVCIYGEVSPNPEVKEVDACAKMIRENEIEFVVALGGGSALDCAKASATMCFLDESVRKYHGTGVPMPQKHLPLIAVPTTAGTGSEVTCVAVLSDHELGKKGPIVSNGFYPSVAMIDPELTYTLPPRITASTGIDVLCHALEGFWSKGHQPICDALALHACEIVFQYLRRAYKDPQDKEARSKMAEASVIAGLAFTLPKTTSSHACSFPLTNLYHIPHGEACGMTLDYFARINAEVENGRVHEFARKLGFADTYAMADAIHELKVDLGLRNDLKDFHLTDEQVAELVKTSKHPNILNNPVEITEEMLNEMYQSMR